MTSKKFITVHCWLPDVRMLAVGLMGFGGVLGTVLAGFLPYFSWAGAGQLLAGLLLLGYWFTYCRVRIMPWEVLVLGSGLWKGRYSCPLEETDTGFRLLPEWVAPANYYSPCLSFSSTEDWDTGTEYVEIGFYGVDALNCFSKQHLTAIDAALRTMAARRRELESAPTTDLLPSADA